MGHFFRAASYVALPMLASMATGCEEPTPVILAQPAPLPTVSAPAKRHDTTTPTAEEPGFDDAALTRLLADSGKLAALLAAPGRHRLQVLVGTIAPGDGHSAVRPVVRPVVRQAGYRVDAEYIYPASAIKTLLSVATLAATEERGGDVDTPLGVCEPTCRAIRDGTNRGRGVLTVGHAIRKIQLVSDNDAFGQLFDFVGRDELNRSLWELGLHSVRLHHRMGKRPDELGPPPIIGLVLEGDRRVERARESMTLPPTPAARLDVGRAHIDDLGRHQETPMSFAEKNYASLRDLQALNVALVMPHARGALPLGLAERHRRWLLRAMTEHPNDSDNPRYRGPRYGVDAHKPLLVGVRRVIDEERIRYVGKAGRAYGFHLANAYIEDRQSHRGIFVTAALYVNPNEVVNDNRYSYDGTTAPFMADLGEVLARRLLR